MQPTGSNPFIEPAAPGGGDPAPRPRDLEGALVAYHPTQFVAAGAPGNTTGLAGQEPRDRVTANLFVLEAPRPIVFGGSPEYEAKPTPHYLTVQAPARFKDVWISNANIVRALAPGGVPAGGIMLGRVVRSDIGNRPFNLESVKGTPDEARMIELWSRLQMGAAVWNDPVPLNGVVPPSTPVSYAPTMPAPAPAVPTVQAFPAAPVDPAYAAWLATQAPAPAAAPAPPFPNALPPHLLAAGWTEATWAQLSDTQRAQVLAATAAPQTAAAGAAVKPNPW